VARSIYSRILRFFLLSWAGAIVAYWIARSFLPAGYHSIVFIGASLAAAIACAGALSWSITNPLRKLKLMAEAVTRNEWLLGITDLQDDEIRDVGAVLTDVHKVTANLNAALAQRDEILEGMTEALLVVDSELRVRFCNSSFAAGIAGHDAPQRGASILTVVRDPELLDLIKNVIRSGTPALARKQVLSVPGRIFQVRASPLSMSGRTGALVLLLDITELERLERIRKDFVANVSHELRTPLAAIRGYAETLLGGGFDDLENRAKFAEIILAQANRLNNIASDLLALSDIESGVSLPTMPLSIIESVNTAFQTVEAEALTQGVELIRGDIPPDLKVFASKTRLEQVLINLLDNAIKFNRHGGNVRLDVERRDDASVRVSVSDSGIGIPSADLSRIFERFYRVDKGRSRAVGGTGLGLSIVKHAMEQMNGTIEVESALGKGSRFTIALPIAHEQQRN
jgi:two-component system phosphate regulon sensor histidine kinase PhoR